MDEREKRESKEFRNRQLETKPAQVDGKGLWDGRLQEMPLAENRLERGNLPRKHLRERPPPEEPL